MNPVAKTITTWYRNVLRNPKYRWWVILGTLLYLVSPLDISPDVVPILGQIDDVAILMLLVSEVFQMLTDPQTEMAEEPMENAPSAAASDRADNTVDVDAVSVD
jgi:uncharacterized membrane protein YkvA (DUF1232 family)